MSLEGAYGEFDVVKEGWNWYKLRDGSKLKTKFVLVKAVFSGVDEIGGVRVSVNSSNVVGSVDVPPNLKGTPSDKKYSREELASSVVEEDIPFDILNEGWNEYRFKNDVQLSVKLTLVKVSRTNKYLPDGDPIYLVNTQPIIKPKLTSEITRKPPSKGPSIVT